VPPVRRLVPRPASLLALGAGWLVALSLPPWGWWPTAFVGVALFGVALGDASTAGRRARVGWMFAAGWLSMGMGWMWFLTAPGYVVATALFAGFHAAAAAAVPAGRHALLTRPIAHTLAEALRFMVPFGGVPLASLPIGQAGGPLLGVARLGGVVLLTWVVLQLGMLGADAGAMVRARTAAGGRAPTAAPSLSTTARSAAIVFVIVAAALVAPDGRSWNGGEPGLQVRVAIVQGGGPQGTQAINTSSRDVVVRHLQATATIEPGSVDVVLWPENVIDVPQFDTSVEYEEIAAEAERIGAVFAVGVTEDTVVDGESRFLNAQVVVGADGSLVSRYDKVRRVPFGEYMPLRGLLSALGAPTDLVPRDAVAGTDPAVLLLPDGTLVATVISWEVFFGSRAADGVGNGGTWIANPTNGSSYTGTVLQSQQVASSRLRAVEFGRWVTQAAPTGFSAFVDPSGRVLQRTGVSEQRVLFGSVTLADGRTMYSRLGDWPFIAALIVAWAAIAVRDRRRVEPAAARPPSP
jgi:apolipoprotein N-acyltransferase